MSFAELLPKPNAPCKMGELIFCSDEEGLSRARETRPAGRLLIVTDAYALQAFRCCQMPRALRLVLDSDDCLPLFSSSDDASLIVASGRESTLVSARFFAQIRNIPCVLFPVSAALDGAFEKFGNIRLGEVSGRVPLADATVCCDPELLAPSLGQSYMRLLLSRLALIEAKALKGLGVNQGAAQAQERAYQALLSIKFKTLDFEDVVQKNARIRRCERDGMAMGEGRVLAREIGYCGEEQAFFLLSALYSAFFTRGKPRLRVPDYAARARAASAAYATQRVPTVQEFARRAALLERIRAEMAEEIERFLEGGTHFKKNFYTLTGRAPVGVQSTEPLQRLPELGEGLSSLIRDFGLMDWKERKIF